jgi:3-oxoacyl-[acyl-carrier protein] reductase
MRLENRVAFVTGAATGLGRVYAVRLAAEGAHVCAADVNASGVEGTARLVEEKGRKALAVAMDVTSEEQTLAGAKRAFEHFGRIDILVNNAGIVRNTPRIPIEETSVDDWNRIVAVNLTGTFLVSRAVVPYMKKSEKGKVINISSGVALHGRTQSHQYVSSKMGVIGLTRSLASELGPYNINVNAITPGGVETSQVREGHEVPSEHMMRQRCIERHLYPNDLDGVVAFLASDESDMISGQVINVDGGRVFIA